MDENTQAKFEEKLKGLLAVAKKKKNVLEYQEVSDYFADMALVEEQFDKVLEFLEQNGIDVLRITEEDVDDEEIILTEEIHPFGSDESSVCLKGIINSAAFCFVLFCNSDKFFKEFRACKQRLTALKHKGEY